MAVPAAGRRRSACDSGWACPPSSDGVVGRVVKLRREGRSDCAVRPRGRRGTESPAPTPAAGQHLAPGERGNLSPAWLPKHGTGFDLSNSWFSHSCDPGAGGTTQWPGSGRGSATSTTPRCADQRAGPGVRRPRRPLRAHDHDSERGAGPRPRREDAQEQRAHVGHVEVQGVADGEADLRQVAPLGGLRHDVGGAVDAETSPSGPTSAPRSRVMVPGPQPTSSTRMPSCRCGSR